MLKYRTQEEAVVVAVKRERERCAKIAETEPEPSGEMPIKFHLVSMEDAIRATIRATNKSIAARIRQQTT